MKKLSVVIPVFNEAATLGELLTRVENAKLPEGIAKEIIVIDDCSTDTTRDVISAYFADKTPLDHKKIFLKENKGKGGAVKEGLRYVTGDYVVIQDADLEYNPDEYTALLTPILEGRATSVFGSRNLSHRNQPTGRMYLYGGVGLTAIYNLLFGTHYTDINTCYKVFPASLNDAVIHCPDNSFTFDAVELTHVLMHRAKVLEVAITYAPRSFSSGKKIRVQHGIKMLWRMIVLRLGFDAWFAQLRYKAVMKHVRPDTVVIDIGCGPYMNLLRLIKNKIQRGIGIDRRLVKGWSEDNLELMSFDFDQTEKWPVEQNTADQVFALALIEHVEKPEIVSRNAFRMLKKGGDIYMTTPTPFSKPILEFLAFRIGIIDRREIEEHKHYFTKKELITLLEKAGFTDIRHNYFEFGCNHLIRARK